MHRDHYTAETSELFQGTASISRFAKSTILKPKKGIMMIGTWREEDPALTTTKAAKLLGVATSTVQIWMENGVIASWKTPGGHRRIRESDVRALMERLSGRSDRNVLRKSLKLIDPEYRPDANLSTLQRAAEALRLKAVAASNLVDTLPEERFNRIVRLAAQATGSPIALISLLTSRRQWFKARIGFQLPQTPVGWSICAYAIEQANPFVVEDTMSDKRFSDNPLVIAQPHVRFYAGIPLRDNSGMAIGTLCVMDREPRKLRISELQALIDLAAIATREIDKSDT